jgi:hypothetical protein
MSDPAYQLDPAHPANKDLPGYPPQSTANDRHRDAMLEKDTSTWHGLTAGPRAELPEPEAAESEPQPTEVDRLFPDRERVAEARQAQRLLGYLPSQLPAGNIARSAGPESDGEARSGPTLLGDGFTGCGRELMALSTCRAGLAGRSRFGIAERACRLWKRCQKEEE